MASSYSLALQRIMTSEAKLHAEWRLKQVSSDQPKRPPRPGRGRNQRQLRKIARQVR